MNTKRVICYLVEIFRMVSSLRNPKIGYCMVYMNRSIKPPTLVVLTYPKIGKRSLPESKHNPQ